MSSAANPLPPLDAATEATLRASIQKFGVLLPIVVDLNGNILDGHHRIKIAHDLGKTYQVIVVVMTVPKRKPSSVNVIQPDGTKDTVPIGRVSYVRVRVSESWDEIARSLNVDRRHLTTEQRRAVVAHLRASGDHSNRAIAVVTGVSEAQVRKDIKAEELRTGTQLTPATVTGIDGRTRTSTPARKMGLVIGSAKSSAAKVGRSVTRNTDLTTEQRQQMAYAIDRQAVEPWTAVRNKIAQTVVEEADDEHIIDAEIVEADEQTRSIRVVQQESAPEQPRTIRVVEDDDGRKRAKDQEIVTRNLIGAITQAKHISWEGVPKDLVAHWHKASVATDKLLVEQIGTKKATRPPAERHPMTGIDPDEAYRICEQFMCSIEDLMIKTHNDEPWDLLTAEHRKALTIRWKRNSVDFTKFLERKQR